MSVSGAVTIATAAPEPTPAVTSSAAAATPTNEYSDDDGDGGSLSVRLHLLVCLRRANTFTQDDLSSAFHDFKDAIHFTLDPEAKAAADALKILPQQYASAQTARIMTEYTLRKYQERVMNLMKEGFPDRVIVWTEAEGLLEKARTDTQKSNEGQLKFFVNTEVRYVLRCIFEPALTRDLCRSR